LILDYSYLRRASPTYLRSPTRSYEGTFVVVILRRYLSYHTDQGIIPRYLAYLRTKVDRVPSKVSYCTVYQGTEVRKYFRTFEGTKVFIYCTVYSVHHCTPIYTRFSPLSDHVRRYSTRTRPTRTVHVHTTQCSNSVRIMRKLLKLTCSCTVQFVYEGTVQRTVHINSYGSTTGTVQQRESECV
jgi:hypothetical protein